MPENEAMVPAGRTSTRWRPLEERLDLGANPIALFEEIRGEFHGAVRGILSRWRRHGVDPAAFFADPGPTPGRSP